jgi:hypothetical protein
MGKGAMDDFHLAIGAWGRICFGLEPTLYD